MTDERDKRRTPHRDRLGRSRTPAAGVPVAREVHGECDSDDGDHRDDPTPVGAASRRPRPVEVDAEQFRADVYADAEGFEWARAMAARIDAAEARADAAHAIARQADARWRWPMRAAGVLAAGTLGAAAYVLTETRARGYEARETELYRSTVDKHTEAIEKLREGAAEIRGELRRGYPFRAAPVSGPRNSPDKDEIP